MQQAVESLNTNAILSNNKMKEQQKLISELQEERKKLGNDFKNKNEETEKLRAQIRQLEEEIKNKKAYIVNLESDLSTISEMSSQVTKQSMEISQLKDLLKAQTAENETLHMSIANLQNILEENNVCNIVIF